MNQNLKNIATSFNGILNHLVDGEKYKDLPPKAPDTSSPSVSDTETNAAKNQDVFGNDEADGFFSEDDKGRTSLVEEDFIRKEVFLPDKEHLDGLNIIGIVGDNKRILTPSFHLILSRAAIVNFRYTRGYEKPYFYTKYRDATALMQLDSNIFESSYSIHTYNKLIDSINGSRILDHILYKNSENNPFLFRYNHERDKKAPSSQSLGLAVKFQHTLELASISDIDFNPDETLFCFKEGALFSNSVELNDIKDGLSKLLEWQNKKRIFIAVNTYVSQSRVLLNTLCSYPQLIEKFFPNQNITIGVVKSFGTDSLLLKKILAPGFRTPLIEYIEKTREGAISGENYKGLKPVTCYYHKRSRPYNFIRLEMPKFMWEQNKELAELAISVAIWQYELGGDKLLVLKTATERSNLEHDRTALEQQMKAVFEKKDLEFVEFLNFGG